MAETKLDPKQAPSPEASKADKLSPKDLLALQKALGERAMPNGPNALNDILEETTARVQDQRQEQQLYASTWGGTAGVIAALIKITDHERGQTRRKALEAMQAEMFELMAKEKKKDALRNSPFFKQLVSILGHDTAESITQKLEAAGSSWASGLQANQAALAQASKDIAVLLEKNQAVLGLRVSGENLVALLEKEITSAVTQISKPAPQLSVVKSEDALAGQVHETMKGLVRGDERLARLQGLQKELGPEKFAAMLDAYDAKYGIPLIVHIASLSTSNPLAQAEMMHNTGMLLSLAQQERVMEYGRAEYAQTMALIDKHREMARDNLRDVTATIRATEKALAESLGRPELAYLPEGAVRGKMLEELTTRFPGLKGKRWEGAYVQLKEVAGQSDPAAFRDALHALLGGKEVRDPEGLREYIARATLQMQKLEVLDQQVSVYNNILSTNETSDEAKLRKHYEQVYGTEATTRDAAFDALKKVASNHIDNLHQRISDPSLGSEERAILIRERDALEFSSVKKLAADALHGAPSPDPQSALAILKNFAVGYADTPARRSDAFRNVCDQLIKSIESADTLRRAWQDLDVNQFGNLELKRVQVSRAVSCIDGRPARTDDFKLAERFAELNANRKEPINSRDALERFMSNAPSTARNTKPAPNETQVDVLRAQRQAALSTDFFAHILDNRVQHTPAPSSLATVESKGASSKAKESLDQIIAATGFIDGVSEKLRKDLVALEAAPRSSYLSIVTQRSLTSGLSPDTCTKLGTQGGAEAVSKVIRELDPVRDLLVDREVLDTVRKVVPPGSEVGKAFAAVPSGSPNVMSEYEAVKARLDPTNALRLDLLLARETDARAQGKPSVVATLAADIFNLEPQALFTAAVEAREHARLSRIERLLGALTDEEHQEFLRFFEATTQRSIGQALIARIPSEDSRNELLLRIAGSRSATSRDLQRFYSEPVPNDRGARVAALSRAINSDAQRPAVKTTEALNAAQMSAYNYSTLREAVKVAMSQGDVVLVGEIAEKMRAIEARMSGVTAKTVAQLDATYVARAGIREQLQEMHEGVFQAVREEEVPGRPNLAALAKETAELLRAAPPKTDAAFNRIRQANLNAEETLYLRALYTQETKRISPQLEQRPVTGDLRKDLEPAKVTADDKERIGFLVEGGQEALLEADKRTLLKAAHEHDEKRQLETLSNLRASGAYDKVKDSLPSIKLSPAAEEYHKAVVSGDKTKADAADLAIKAKNGDVKPEEVAKFLKDKNPEDLARIAKGYPNLAKDLHAANPFVDEKTMAQLLSDNAAARQRAIEQAMLTSLTDPNAFAAWLDVQGSKEQKRERIRNLEALVATLPNAPRFVEGPESKIVQYVRAQRTDFREIDAHVINHIIVSRLSEDQTLRPATVDKLLRLREEAVVRMATLDAFERPRRTIYNAAQEDLIQKRTYLGEALDDQGKRYFSAGRYDGAIAMTRSRISEQEALIRPMGHGIRDIESSRELVRYAFALMAKDTIARVDKGLTPDVTDHVTTLLVQRDQKITYKVTDHKRDAEWRATVKATAESIESFDRWATIGLGTAKVATTIAAGIFFSPAAGLIVATAWNVGDKVYRRTVGKEALWSLTKSFAFELAIDATFAYFAALKTTTVTFAGGNAVKGTAAEGFKVTKRVWEFRPWESILKPHSLKEVAKSGQNIVHSFVVVGVTKEQAKETFGKHLVLQQMGEKYFQRLAELVPDAMTRSNWAQLSTGRFIRFLNFSSVPTPPATAVPTVPVPKEEPKVEKHLPEPLKGGDKVSASKKNDPIVETEDFVFVPKKDTKSAATEPSAAPATVAPPPSPPAVSTPTPSIDVPMLLQIEDRLRETPNAAVQQALDECKNVEQRQDLSPERLEEERRKAAEALEAALAKWTPYPELSKALSDLLRTENPWSALFGALSDSGGRGTPPPFVPPTPPAGAPPTQPKKPGPSSGPGGGGMSGPTIVFDPTPRTDSQAPPRRDGGADDQRGSVPNLSNSSIGVPSPRSDLQNATTDEALRRSSGQVPEEARTIPHPQMQAQPTATPSSTSLQSAATQEGLRGASLQSLDEARAIPHPQMHAQPTATPLSTSLQSAATQEELRGASLQSLEEARAIPHPQMHPHASATASSTYVSLNQDLLQSVQLAAVGMADEARTQVTFASSLAEQNSVAASRQSSVSESFTFLTKRKDREKSEELLHNAELRDTKADKNTEKRGLTHTTALDEAPKMMESSPKIAQSNAESRPVAQMARLDEAPSMRDNAAERERAEAKVAEKGYSKARQEEISAQFAQESNRTIGKSTEKTTTYPQARESAVSQSHPVASTEAELKVKLQEEGKEVARHERILAAVDTNKGGGAHNETKESRIVASLAEELRESRAVLHGREQTNHVVPREVPNSREQAIQPVRREVANSREQAIQAVSREVPHSREKAIQPVLREGAAPEDAARIIPPNVSTLHEERETTTEDVLPTKPVKVRGGARKIQSASDERMRELLLQQLMAQHTTIVRREKILKALITLGISEIEYRKLLIKLGEMDAARLAEQVAARAKVEQPIAMKVDPPSMKDPEESTQPNAEASRSETKLQTTRAALYKRLKEEASSARK